MAVIVSLQRSLPRHQMVGIGPSLMPMLLVAFCGSQLRSVDHVHCAAAS
jgi:hypothetical protein